MTELNIEEILAAADRAAVYPENEGLVYISGTNAESATIAAELLLDKPELLERG